MSTLRVDNFGPSAGGTSYSARGIAKAYCNADAAGAVNDGQSVNISSLTDVGTGDIDFTLTNAVASTSTTCVTSAGSSSARIGQASPGWSSTSTFQYQCYNSSGSAANAGQNYMTVLGELA